MPSLDTHFDHNPGSYCYAVNLNGLAKEKIKSWLRVSNFNLCSFLIEYKGVPMECPMISLYSQVTSVEPIIISIIIERILCFKNERYY